MRRVLVTLAALAIGHLSAPAARGEPWLAISPPSGGYTTAQAFDVVLGLLAPGRTVVGGTAFLNGTDVTGGLASCLIPGATREGVQTFRCPGVGGPVFGAGTQSLWVTLVLDDGSSVTDVVLWAFLPVGGAASGPSISAGSPLR